MSNEDEYTLERVRLMVGDLEDKDVIYCLVASYQNEIKIHKSYIKKQNFFIYLYGSTAIGLQILVLWWCI